MNSGFTRRMVLQCVAQSDRPGRGYGTTGRGKLMTLNAPLLKDVSILAAWSITAATSFHDRPFSAMRCMTSPNVSISSSVA